MGTASVSEWKDDVPSSPVIFSMNFVLESQIKKSLAEELLFGKLEHGGHILVTTEGDELKVEVEEKEEAGAVH